MKQHHRVTEVRFDESMMILTIDGQERSFQVSEVSAALQQASEQERNTFEISPSGYGIHWPLLDEDLSIDRLLGVIHAPRKTAESAKALRIGAGEAGPPDSGSNSTTGGEDGGD